MNEIKIKKCRIRLHYTTKVFAVFFGYGIVSMLIEVNSAQGTGALQKKALENKKTQLESRATFKLWTEGANFDTEIPQVITCRSGRIAKLKCRVIDRGNNTISWIRHRDLHILTVGRYTYTADLRFRSFYNQQSQTWILHIRHTTPNDTGRYECQISTQPVRSFFVQLKVLDAIVPSLNNGKYRRQMQRNNEHVDFPKAQILGEFPQYVEVGRFLNITCVVEPSSSSLSTKTKISRRNGWVSQPFLMWYHGNKIVKYSSPSDRIYVSTSANVFTPIGGQDRSGVGIRSTLIVNSVRHTDSGQYSCQPSNAKTATVSIHVVDGDHQAAIHTNKANKISVISSLMLSLLLCRISNLNQAWNPRLHGLQSLILSLRN